MVPLLFPQHLEEIIPLRSGHPYCVLLYVICPSSLAFSKYFLLIFGFHQFDYDVLGCDVAFFVFLHLVCLGFTQLLHLFHHIYKIVAIFSNIFLSFSLFWGLQVQFLLLSFSFFTVQLDNCYWSISKLTDSFAITNVWIF